MTKTVSNQSLSLARLRSSLFERMNTMRFIKLSLCGLALCAAAQAEPLPQLLCARIELYQVRDSVRDSLANQRHWPTQVEAQLVQSSETLLCEEDSSQIALVQQFPIHYFDARANNNQINYVDVGFKFDISVKPDAQGKLTVRAFPEYSVLQSIETKDGRNFPQTQLLQSRMVQPIELGQREIVARYSGHKVRQNLKASGLANDPGRDNLFFVITVWKAQ